ncbi:MAG TPA: sigma-54 dependent transcriptional regulator, partial [Myxococcales bacterium]|nr:sigma-54 dependent transcriptional regulator [Myxococcales bacterium]
DGYDVVSVNDPVEVLAMTSDPTIDLVVSDVRMPALSGMDLLKAFKQVQPEVEVIIMTGHGTIEMAVEAVKGGAYDYLTKPFERLEDFTHVVSNAVERRALRKRTAVLEDALDAKSRFEGMIGQSAQMRAVYRLVETVSPSGATVLIQGESGTGKELVAKAIHFRSPRKDRPFVAVNCSALTETLLESELFGHVKGAFTGAVSNKKGLFEAAHGGTIFLDEIGDIPPSTQVRLLRVLQEGEVKRVGGTDPIQVDARVIAATNVDLIKAKAEGRFREDLFYRLNVITLTLPPLRDRPDDVPVLAQHFLHMYSERMGKKVAGLTPEALQRLTLAAWSGNVRELENVIERAVVLTQKDIIDVDDLPPELRSLPARPSAGGEGDVTALAHLRFAEAKSLAVAAFERRYLAAVMERAGGNITQAALAAGMDRSNFRRLLKEHGMAGKAGPGEGEP